PPPTTTHTLSLPDALPISPADCVVTDVGSTKRALVEEIGDERFCGGHPIAGAETAGVQNARSDLFEGAAWYLTPRAHTSGILYRSEEHTSELQSLAYLVCR